MLLYIILFLILFYFAIHVWYRIRYGFWSHQPVKHWYNPYYWIYSSCGIISHELPEKNKYINTTNVRTYVQDQVSDDKKKQLWMLLRLHSQKKAGQTYNPTKEAILTSFLGHNYPSFWSFYFHKEHLIEQKSGAIVENDVIHGAITSFPLHLLFPQNEKMDIYYINTLCVQKTERKKSIAYQLIQTHEYNQSRINKNICVSLFKREGYQNAIVPLTSFTKYKFSMKFWGKPLDFPPQISILNGDKQNIHYFYDFLKEKCKEKNILIGLPEMSNLIFLMERKLIFVKMVMFQMEIKSVYFFKRTFLFDENNNNSETLLCIGSVNGSLNETDFIQGFKISLYKTITEHKDKETKLSFGYSEIENICDNDVIIRHIAKKTQPLELTHYNYYFYNFAYKNISNKNVFIVC